jgi:hypothetical protein
MKQVYNNYKLKEQQETAKISKMSPEDWYSISTWMYSVCVSLYTPDVCFLANRILAEYTSKDEVLPSERKLAGITCLVLASKFEEETVRMRDVVEHIKEDNIGWKSIVTKEREILENMEYKLNRVTSRDFLTYFVWKLDGHVPFFSRIKTVAFYLLFLFISTVRSCCRLSIFGSIFIKIIGVAVSIYSCNKLFGGRY